MSFALNTTQLQHHQSTEKKGAMEENSAVKSPIRGTAGGVSGDVVPGSDNKELQIKNWESEGRVSGGTLGIT